MNNDTYLTILKKGSDRRDVHFFVKMFPIIFIRFLCAISDHLRYYFMSSSFLKLGQNVSISRNTSFGGTYNIVIGDYVSINQSCNLYGDFGIKIGNFSKLSPNVHIYSASYVIKSGSRLGSLGTKGKPVIIGNNVWVGAGSVILPGVTIGDNCIVGALSVVNKNIPSNELWAGNPARFVRAIK